MAKARVGHTPCFVFVFGKDGKRWISIKCMSRSTKTPIPIGFKHNKGMKTRRDILEFSVKNPCVWASFHPPPLSLLSVVSAK
jgi:hypothetical protein